MAYQPGVNPNAAMYPQFNSGVVPLTVNPIHQFSREALTSLSDPNTPRSGGMTLMAQQMLQRLGSDPQGFAAQYRDPRVNTALDSMGGQLEYAGSQVGQDDVDAYMNPYQKQVVDAYKDEWTDLGNRARAAIMSRTGDSRAFGSSSQALQFSELANDMGRQGSTAIADLLYKGYGDALNQANTQRNRALQVAGGYGSQASMAQDTFANAMGLGGNVIGGFADLGNQIRGNTLGNLQNQMKSGQYIQDYNQRVADLVGGEIGRVTQNTPTRLSELAGYLGQFQPTQQQWQQRPNSLQKIGALAGAAGQFGAGLGIF